MKTDFIHELAASCHLEDTGSLRWFTQKLREHIIQEARAVEALHASPNLDAQCKTPKSVINTLVDRLSFIQ
jgi:hypothetical protein